MGDEVLTEVATQAPPNQQKVEGDEDEEEECVYMFRYPGGSPKFTRSENHPESSAAFLTAAPCVRGGQLEAEQPDSYWRSFSSLHVVVLICVSLIRVEEELRFLPDDLLSPSITEIFNMSSRASLCC